MVFGLAPGGRFLHSPEFRTVFGADEVFTVLRGRMILANPETGEVQLVEAGREHRVRPRHVAPRLRPRVRGAARARAVRAATVDRIVGSVRRTPSVPRVGARTPTTASSATGPAVAARAGGGPTLRLDRPTSDSLPDAGRRADRHAVEHDQLTVANVSLSPGGRQLDPAARRRRGDLRARGTSCTSGRGSQDETYVFELRPDEACFLPAGSVHEYRNYAGSTATAMLGVAPKFLPENDVVTTAIGIDVGGSKIAACLVDVDAARSSSRSACRRDPNEADERCSPSASSSPPRSPRATARGSRRASDRHRRCASS